jgi:ABC-type multidrug transport system ATPase subunit
LITSRVHGKLIIYLCSDAFTAFLLLQNLSALAKKGRTIILSIHAPRSDAWKLFDRVVLLTKGQVAYSGKRDDCLAWFEGLGQHLETGINPLGESIELPLMLLASL